MAETRTDSKRSVWFPGETTWEQWFIAPSRGPQLIGESGEDSRDFTLNTRGQRVVAIPATSVVALPLLSNAPDASGLEATARMQAERSGIVDDPEGVGFEVLNGSPPQTLLRADAPLAGRNAWNGIVSPDRVCVSAGLLPWSGDSVAIWRELGDLIVGFSKNSRLVFYDRLSFSTPGVECGAEVQRLLFQLNCQGIEIRPEALELWTTDAGDVAGLQTASGLQVRPAKRPDPEVEIRCDLSPAWMRNQKLASQARAALRRRLGAVAAVAMVLVGAFGAMGFVESLKQKKLRTQISYLTPIASRVENMKAQWREVAPAVDRDATPLEILRAVQGIPGANGVNLTSVEIEGGRIVIEGEATAPRSALQFLDEITISEAVAGYGWEFDQPEIRPNGSAAFKIEGVK